MNNNPQSPPSTFVKLGYRPALDGLRGLAVLMVMLDHAGSYLWQTDKLSGGGFGVDIFFVLSGFLITVLLLEEWQKTGGISLKNFYARRALRLLPALFGVLLVCVAYAAYISLHSGNKTAATSIIKSALFTLFYIPNLALAFGWTGFNLLAHTWSLGIEEQFYLIWPLSLLLLLKLSPKLKTIAVVIGVGIILAIIYRATLLQLGTPADVLYLRPDTRADSLLLGCFTAVLWHRGVISSIPWSRYFWPAIAIVFGLAAFRPALLQALPMGLYSVLAAAAAVMILGLLQDSVPRQIFEFRPLVYTGRISYGMYLWHFPVNSILVPLLMRARVPTFISLLVLFVSTFVVATISFRLIEQPFLKLKRKLSNVKQKTPDEFDRGPGVSATPAVQLAPEA